MTLPADLGSSSLVPSADRSPVFRRYRDTSWLWVTTATSLVTMAGLLTATVAGFMAAGVLGLVGGVAAGVGAGLWAGLRMSAAANSSLRKRLRQELGVRGRGIFVGLRGHQDDLWSELHRKETDDNVGFVEFEEHGLRVTTEAGKVDLRRDAIIGFDKEPVKAMPMLWFIRVQFELDGQEASFLLVSREGDSIREQVEATEVLYRRLVEWYADAQLRWLDAHRGPAALPDPHRTGR